jgi:hypothetical protein
MKLSITDIQHNNALHYAECHYDECRVLFIVMLSVTMLNVVMLNVVACASVNSCEKYGKRQGNFLLNFLLWLSVQCLCL